MSLNLPDLSLVAPTPADPELEPTETAEDRFRAKLLDGPDILALPDPNPVVPGWLYRPSTAAIYGPPGSGKTFVALSLALSLCTGVPWLGNRVVQQKRVLYVVGEGAYGMGKRVAAWSEHHDQNVPHGLTWHNGAVNLTDPAQLGALLAYVRTHQVDVVILDTLARCSVGADENSGKDMSAIVAAVDLIRDATGGIVMLIHHTGKDASRGLRGHSSLLGALDTTIEVAGDAQAFRVKIDKQKDGPDDVSQWARLEPAADSVLAVPTSMADAENLAALKLLDELKRICTGADNPVAATAWMKSSDVPERTFFRQKKWLVEHEFVVETKAGRSRLYHPADSGR